jgi:rhodanese-related sulfurtransferase
MKRFFLPIASLAVLLVASCKPGGDSNVIVVGEFASLTGKEATFGSSSHEGTLLAVEKINEKPGILDRKLRTAWVDPRTTELYAKEHIPGAICLPFPRMQAEAETTLKGYDQFIVYDTDWEDTIGKAASKRLMELGFDNVYTLEGGLKAWKRDGNSVETGVPAPQPGN